MHKFLTFDNFLFEKLGVPVPMINYAKTLTTQVLEELEKLDSEDSDTRSAANMLAQAFHIEIPIPEVKKNIDVSGVPEKLLWKVILKINLRSMPIGDVQRIVDNPVAVEGSSDGFEIHNGKPVTTISINMIAEEDIVREKSWKKYEKLISSTVLHELTHTYEDMMRKKHSSSLLNSHDKPYDMFSTAVRSHQIPPSIGEFFYFIYLEASYEINARIAEVYSLIDGENDKQKRLEIIKKSLSWKQAEKLKNWNAKEFVKSFENIEMDTSDDTPEKKVLRVMNDIKNYLAGIKRSMEEDPDYNGGIYSAVLKNMNSVEKLFKKDPLSQLQYWEKAFHRAAEKSQRKLLRLVSYEDSPEEK